MLTQIPNRNNGDPMMNHSETPLDFESALSIDTIRAHTKTDDIITVTDDQLKLYRKAAFEAAEQYTGMVLKARRFITESVQQPRYEFQQYGLLPPKADFLHVAQYAFSDPTAFFDGGRVAVQVGSRRVLLPRSMRIDLGGNCDGQSNATALFGYYAGFACGALPAALILGVLKYIAHVIENPGDNVVQVSVAGGTTKGGASTFQAADPALASGALMVWRVLVPDAI